MLSGGYAVQELHGSEVKMHDSRQGRPEADDGTHLTAALRQAHSPAAPQVSMSVSVLALQMMLWSGA